MKFSAAAFLALVAGAAALPTASSEAKRDIWSPKIVYPHAGTVWHLGETHHVQWLTSNPPQNISNGAAIYLQTLVPQLTNVLLAKGFDLHTGSETIVVPTNIAPGTWRIVLWGDSGNVSPDFAIEA